MLLQKATGINCPMCGCTTAWTHLLRGDVLQASIANLGGMLLCAAVVLGSPWMLMVAIWGRWPLARPTWRIVLVIGSAWLAVVVLDWARRIYLGW